TAGEGELPEVLLLLGKPVLEPRALVEVQPGGQVTAVEIKGVLAAPGASVGFELGGVHPHIRAEGQRGPVSDELVAEERSEALGGAAEVGLRLLRLAVRPQQLGEDRARLRALPRQVDEQGGRRAAPKAGERLAAAGEAQAPKCRDTNRHGTDLSLNFSRARGPGWQAASPRPRHTLSCQRRQRTGPGARSRRRRG